MSESKAALSSLIPPAGADAYDVLLDHTRALRREQRAARERWFENLELPDKAEVLFELEVLLKATACFSNPRNHPGPATRIPIVAQDFRCSVSLLRSGLERALALLRQLLGSRDRAFVFQRYLETVLPEDRARTRLVAEGFRQNTPEDALLALRHALTSSIEIFDGVLRNQRVPFRLFYALAGSVQREVARNTFFNPLTALEFRPEFDRLRSTEVLELIRNMPGDSAQRLSALTFLSLFRMLKYIDLLERVARDSQQGQRRMAGRAYPILSVLRSDARALSDYLRRHAGPMLGLGFEQDCFRVPASSMPQRSAELRAAAQRLMSMKSALEAIAGNVTLELRRSFLQDFPRIAANYATNSLSDSLSEACRRLRPPLRNAILFLGKALGASFEVGGVFDDKTALRESSEQLRRDVWMFAQIVRAFSTKAQHSPPEDRWSPVHNFQYVREFLSYFRSMGYPLLRAADYPRVDAFIQAMSALQDTDLVDPERLNRAVSECSAFHAYLEQLFDDISKRTILHGVAFDRRAAAAALRLYLGD